jgi:hypothetical protein
MIRRNVVGKRAGQELIMITLIYIVVLVLLATIWQILGL